MAFFRPELQAQAAPPGCSDNKVTGLMKCARNRDHGSGLEDIIQPAGFIRGRKKERALLETYLRQLVVVRSPVLSLG